MYVLKVALETTKTGAKVERRAVQENVSRECKKSLRWVHTQNFTFTDSVQSLSLHFVFVSQGHGVKRGTAQDGRALLHTAGYLSS